MAMRAHVAVVGAGIVYLLGEHLAPHATRAILPPDAYSVIVLPWILAVALVVPHAAYAAARRLAVRPSDGRPGRSPHSGPPSRGTLPSAVAGEDEEAAYYLDLGRTGTAEEQHVARMGLARIFERRGMVEEAVALYEWSVDRGARERDVFERLARAYRRLGRDGAAAEASEAALTMVATGHRTVRGGPGRSRRSRIGGQAVPTEAMREIRRTRPESAR